MLIIPAIDIKNGKCVRLLQGDPDQETVYFNNPVDVARDFEAKGAELIHVVDLDGAFEGNPVNKDIVIEIARSISIPIEIGGGIRSAGSIDEYLSAGIKRIILGTAVIEDDFETIIKEYKEFIIAGIDAKDFKIATHGWKTVSEISSFEYIKYLHNIGIYEIIYTDISTDGMLMGPNIKSIQKILEGIKNIALIASGGISTNKDILDLNKYSASGLKGCIIGKAIYEKKIDLREAISLVN